MINKSDSTSSHHAVSNDMNLNYAESNSVTSRVENLIETAIAKHKNALDLKLLDCVTQMDNMKQKLSKIEVIHNELTSEISNIKPQVDEIKTTQLEHNIGNKKMHSTTAQLLKKVIDLGTTEKHCNRNDKRYCRTKKKKLR